MLELEFSGDDFAAMDVLARRSTPVSSLVRETGGDLARSAAPAETFDLLCRAYALTRRERDVIGALVAGLDTRAVTELLVISRHTVQDHLKSVFQKVRVRSRRELLATFSASHDQR